MRKRTVQFIVEADEPALFFASKSAAENSLEAFDVQEGTYPIAFDRSGLIYQVFPYKNRALLKPDPEGRSDRSRLMNTLRKFLKASHVEFCSDDTLDDLLEKCDSFL